MCPLADRLWCAGRGERELRAGQQVARNLENPGNVNTITTIKRDLMVRYPVSLLLLSKGRVAECQHVVWRHGMDPKTFAVFGRHTNAEKKGSLLRRE